MLGGGEKYMLDIACILKKRGYECTFLWPHESIREEITKRFGNGYEVNINTDFHKVDSFKKAFMLRSADLFVYQPDGSYPLSFAKKNIALMQVPLGTLSGTGFNAWKRKRFEPVFNSRFTRRFFARILPVEHAPVWYPAVSEDCFKLRERKEQLIISVGRFFRHLHAKRQDVLIDAFIKAQSNGMLRNYSLVLAGSNEDNDYVTQLKRKSRGHRIEFALNVSRSQLLELYGKAKIYWHAAGYGINEKKYPEKVEHFGISIVEAMAARAVPVVYKAGGVKETVRHGYSGFHYVNRRELITYTNALTKDKKLLQSVGENAQKTATNKFSMKALENAITLWTQQ